MTRTTMITPAVNIRRSTGGLASPAPAAWRSAISSGGSSKRSRARVTSEPYTRTSWGILKDDPQSPGPPPSALERHGMPWSRSRCSASRAKGSFSNVVSRTCLRRFSPADKNRSSLNNAKGGAATRPNSRTAGSIHQIKGFQLNRIITNGSARFQKPLTAFSLSGVCSLCSGDSEAFISMKDVPTTCHKAEMARVATAVRVGKAGPHLAVPRCDKGVGAGRGLWIPAAARMTGRWRLQ